MRSTLRMLLQAIFFAANISDLFQTTTCTKVIKKNLILSNDVHICSGENSLFRDNLHILSTVKLLCSIQSHTSTWSDITDVTYYNSTVMG